MSQSVPSAIAAAAAVGFGGFVGALARWGTANLAGTMIGTQFPWGTLIANLLGCFFMGLLKAVFDRSGNISPAVTLALLTGFLGAYTTLATFSLDTLALARNAGGRAAAFYALASVVAGVALCAFGARLGGGLR